MLILIILIFLIAIGFLCYIINQEIGSQRNNSYRLESTKAN